jgi:hypothetical protein
MSILLGQKTVGTWLLQDDDFARSTRLTVEGEAAFGCGLREVPRRVKDFVERLGTTDRAHTFSCGAISRKVLPVGGYTPAT